jgi:hypothetical protein
LSICTAIRLSLVQIIKTIPIPERKMNNFWITFHLIKDLTHLNRLLAVPEKVWGTVRIAEFNKDKTKSQKD